MATDWGAIAGMVTAGAGLAGQIAAQRSAARAGARTQEAAANQTQDNFSQRNYATEQNAALTAASMAEAARLKRAQLGMDAPEQRARQTAWGDVLANVQDASFDMPGHIPKIYVSGGLRPSLLGPYARAAGAGLSTQALQALMTGSDVPEMPDYSKLVMTPPEATPLPEASGQDRWLNIMAALGQVAQGADTMNRTRTQARPPAAQPVTQGATGASDPWGAY
jgi:hypothetical protein